MKIFYSLNPRTLIDQINNYFRGHPNAVITNIEYRRLGFLFWEYKAIAESMIPIEPKPKLIIPFGKPVPKKDWKLIIPIGKPMKKEKDIPSRLIINQGVPVPK